MGKEKRKSPSSSALVPPPQGITSLVPPNAASAAALHTQKKQKNQKNVSGKEIMEGLRLIMELPQLKGKWFTAEDLCKAIPKVYRPLKGKESLITTYTFTRAMNEMKTFGGDAVLKDYFNANTHGVFANQYNIDGAPKTWCYLFAADKNKPCPFPPPKQGFKPDKMPDRFVHAAASSPSQPSAPSAPSTNNNNNTQTPARGGDESTTTVTPAPNNTSTTPKQSAADLIAQQSYFCSGVAWNLFMPSSMNKNEYLDEECEALVLAEIDKRIKICERSSKEKPGDDESNSFSWYFVVKEAKPDDDISEYQKERIRYKCTYIKIALRRARQMMGKGLVTWMDCCQSAIEPA